MLSLKQTARCRADGAINSRRTAYPFKTVVAVCAALSVLTNCSWEKRTTYSYDPDYGVESLQFVRSLEGIGERVQAFNSAELLNNGDGFFPAILDSIRKAEHSVNIELYIYAEGEVGSRYAKALSEKAREGVPVRVLVDSVGSRMGKLEDEMAEAGVKVMIYKPIRLYSINRVSDRTHRKIITIDGKVGYIGGLAIDDRWKGDARTPDEWRDVVVRLEGPVVKQLQSIFMQDWLYTTGEVLHGDGEFPQVMPVGDMTAQVIASSNGDQSSMAKLHYLTAIKAARRTVWIENAYFVPDYDFIDALIAAVKRGVDVRLVVPGEITDFKALRRASQGNYRELLEGGVRIYEFQPSMLHTKLMVVDGIFSSIGSINFVSRSMEKNAEANVVIYDRRFAREAEAAVGADIARSEEITLEAWKKRGAYQKFKEWFYGLFSGAF